MTGVLIIMLFILVVSVGIGLYNALANRLAADLDVRQKSEDDSSEVLKMKELIGVLVNLKSLYDAEELYNLMNEMEFPWQDTGDE